MRTIKNIWKRHIERKAEANAYSQIWKDHYERILEIEKKESWAYGFLCGIIFTGIFLLVLDYILKIVLW